MTHPAGYTPALCWGMAGFADPFLLDCRGAFFARTLEGT